ncbi:hypothetical protein GE21DRAFT_1341856 [Neurospora crassa]|nr:hypothetical protein GE21DRAFT_1341856 [Neurospora crassa]
MLRIHPAHKKNRKVIVHTSNVCCTSGSRHNKGGRPRPFNTMSSTNSSHAPATRHADNHDQPQWPPPQQRRTPTPIQYQGGPGQPKGCTSI